MGLIRVLPYKQQIRSQHHLIYTTKDLRSLTQLLNRLKQNTLVPTKLPNAMNTTPNLTKPNIDVFSLKSLLIIRFRITKGVNQSRPNNVSRINLRGIVR